jgi:hypothetical protein
LSFIAFCETAPGDRFNFFAVSGPENRLFANARRFLTSSFDHATNTRRFALAVNYHPQKRHDSKMRNCQRVVIPDPLRIVPPSSKLSTCTSATRERIMIEWNTNDQIWVKLTEFAPRTRLTWEAGAREVAHTASSLG